ncbi:MAG TPA: hypothetical protein VFH54_12600 [Mycobacteriales bacterium]|nr:hypothetical protein [Mycobacteriales bacterium]
MDEMECHVCGYFEGKPDEYEMETVRGYRGKKVEVPRCVDKLACARRKKAEDRSYAGDVLAEIRETADDIRAARDEISRREKYLAEQVKEALNYGAGATAVARAAGLSRERIYQIRDGRR